MDSTRIMTLGLGLEAPWSLDVELRLKVDYVELKRDLGAFQHHT